MKLITTEGGRNLDRLPIEEVRPPGGVFVPDMIRGMVERYQFTGLPQNLTDAIKDGVKLEHGKMVHNGATIAIKELSVYADGVIADAFNTDLADAVLDDFFSWATATFKLKERSRPIHRTRVSAVVVEFEKQIDTGLGKMAEICGLMSVALKSSYGWDYKYDPIRIAFAVDPTTIPQYRNTAFILERRAAAPHSENRYFSSAPLRTADHVRLLETIEKTLLS